jgi:hypothetical protein
MSTSTTESFRITVDGTEIFNLSGVFYIVKINTSHTHTLISLAMILVLGTVLAFSLLMQSSVVRSSATLT